MRKLQRHVIVAVLVAFVAVNFADKAIFGLCAVPIMRELALSHAQFGAIGSSFFALFSLSALVAGRLGERIRPGLILVAMAGVWTFAQTMAALSSSAVALTASRVVLGAGEGPSFPFALHVALSATGDRARATASGFLLAGAPLGTALAALSLTPLIFRFGWRAGYLAIAVASLLWMAVWLIVQRSVPRAEPPPKSAPVSFAALLANRTTIGAMLASFAGYLSSSIALVWYPKFFETSGFSPSTTGTVLAVVWAAQIPVCIGAGLLLTRLVASMREPGTLYGAVGCAALAFTGLAVAGMSFGSHAAVVAFAVANLVAVVITFVALAALVAEIAPVERRSSVLGAYAAFYALAGAFGPYLFGLALDLGGPANGFRQAFVALGVTLLAVAALSAWLIRPASDRALIARRASTLA